MEGNLRKRFIDILNQACWLLLALEAQFIYSTAPEADRAFLRDVLRLPNVNVGKGWLIALLDADSDGMNMLCRTLVVE